MKKIVKYILLGVVVGFAMMVVSLLFLLLFHPQAEDFLTKPDMLRNIWVSALIGIAFYVPSLVYENDRIPRKMQVLIHMGIGHLVFFPLAFYAKWIPVESGVGAIIGFMLTIIVVSFAIWFAFYLYYKNEVKHINEKLKKQKGSNE